MKDLIDNDQTAPLYFTRWKDKCGRYFYDVKINGQFLAVIPATSFSKKVRDCLVKAYFTGVYQASVTKQPYSEKK